MIDVLATMMMMMLPSFIFVMLSEDHLLAAWRMLGHVHVWVSKVMVIAPSGLISLMMERAFLVLNTMSRRSRSNGLVTLVRAQVVLLS